MLDPKTKSKLDVLAKDLGRLRNQLSFSTSLLTPVNYREEREKFFQNSKSNPQFIYKRPADDPSVHRRLLVLTEQIRDTALPREISSYLRHFAEDLHHAYLTRWAIGTPVFAKYAKRMYPYSIRSADALIRRLPDFSFAEVTGEPLHTAEEMRLMFQQYIFAHPHISTVNVTVDYLNDHTVRAGHRRLTIGAAIKRNRKNVKRLIVHEIESHLLQRHNLHIADSALLRLQRFSEKELYSEGLAIFNEIYTGLLTKSAYEYYYYRLKAVELIDRSFREIFDELTYHIGDKKAFLITSRVKRGMGDTSRPGGYPKDAAYLLGFQEVHEYLKNGGPYELLYLSRVPDLGQLLLKYDLLPRYRFALPGFWKKE